MRRETLLDTARAPWRVEVERAADMPMEARVQMSFDNLEHSPALLFGLAMSERYRSSPPRRSAKMARSAS
jgi:hypothetical protein